MQQGLVLLSNNVSDQVLQEFTTIKKATEAFCDCFILYHQHENYIPDVFKDIDYELFTDNILTDLNYRPIENSLLPGSNHFPLLKFYLKYPHYEYYWLIEDDVKFNGDWRHFFPVFNKEVFVSDLISSAIRSYAEQPGWFWWNSIKHPVKDVPHNLKIRSFNPIYRISNAALQFIHNSLIAGWYGHHEVLIPTLLHVSGFKLIDFGGRGKFVIPGFENKFYTNPTYKGSICNGGSFRDRPAIAEMTKENLLYHPVKAIKK
jgi:hypothetical protein